VRELSGRELVGFIKERQAHQVRGLRQAWHVNPKLLILGSGGDPVSAKYVELKRQYGEDILVEVEERVVGAADLSAEIERANADDSVHGIIVQLPFAGLDGAELDATLGAIAPQKDVDGLSGVGDYAPATAEAIDWLLGGYNVELAGKKIAIVGQGRLVGAPLAKLWGEQGLRVRGFDAADADNLPEELPGYDIIISATGQPGLITPQMVQTGAVVVDAGTASENGVLKGDASDDLRARRDISITPKIGGVGPLTVAVLFDHVIQAATSTTKKS
jgi:methylenetetrahydrofolate dehydrogenase (NADP+)/methenyltetrahydrofolate cyclohydrolase